jgi:hypothetical protein
MKPGASRPPKARLCRVRCWRSRITLPPPALILRPERRLGRIERRRVPVALAVGEQERHVPKPNPVRLLEDAPDVTGAVDHVEVGLRPGAGWAGGASEPLRPI